jgi:hypothetical protein
MQSWKVAQQGFQHCGHPHTADDTAQYPRKYIVAQRVLTLLRADHSVVAGKGGWSGAGAGQVGNVDGLLQYAQPVLQCAELPVGKEHCGKVGTAVSKVGTAVSKAADDWQAQLSRRSPEHRSASEAPLQELKCAS